jgi:outer membrane receptor protein involved in Fe transport
MYRLTRIALAFLSTTLPFFAAAQGIVRGIIIEDKNGEGLIGVTVVVKGTTTGAITDFDGNFEIKLDPGEYDLQVSFISFETVTITGVLVQTGKVTLLNGIRLKEYVKELEGVTITADVIRNSESALLTVKKKSPNLIDGISSVNFKKIGDSDAAGAVKRVTGVSVEGGKYVYVRGLGDRYTKTTLNNVDIPGLDPDRNSMQMDIFPTNLIDNIMVMKSSLAEMPADFTGGAVNIETKDFPDEKIFDISLGIGYNPGMHLRPDYLVYEGGKTDFLGFDDGTRSLPGEARNNPVPSPVSGDSQQDVNAFLNKFNPTLGAKSKTSFMDYSLGVSFANQTSLKGDKKLGYILSTTYKSSTKFYDEVIYGEYQRLINPSLYELRYATIQNGSVGEHNVLLGGLGGIALKTKNSKLKFTIMHLQNGESKAGQFFVDNDGEAVGQSGYFASSDNLEYTQRGLTNLLLNGEKHSINTLWKLDWSVSPTFSKITNPDIRKTAFTQTVVDTLFSAGAGGNPNRIWRYLEELNLVSKAAVSKDYKLFGESAKLKFGASHIFKMRDYEILSFDMQFFGTQPDFNADPNNVLNNTNLFPNGTLYYSSGNNIPNPNQYYSSVHNTGIFVSNEFSPLANVKAIIGLRGEKYVQRHTGRDVEYASLGTGNNLDNEKVLDAFDIFPSLNLIYSLNDQQNLRFSYSRTIARPSFKELSFAQIIDPITNRIFNGGLFTYPDWEGKLTETRIDNFDLRWEFYIKRGELISASAFYKTFDDPIELVRIPEQQTSTEYQPRNVGDGRLFGAEIELRKNLDFFAPSLENFNISGNFTYVRSQIDMTNTEFNSRKTYEKDGQEIENVRVMAGQAPYIINAGFSYNNPVVGLDGGFFYNVKGATLVIVGAGLFPDVFAKPFHSLNFNMNKTLGSDQRSIITLSISNLLNSSRKEVYSAFRAKDQNFTRFEPGTTISVGWKYSF